ncbi:MAG: hypothetical protein U9Q81_26270 [Pseudomonadota bacterium]|nr:hypothetical protein [Pseudomonadota bacterium]
MRIRHFGFLANRWRRERLVQIRQAIATEKGEAAAQPSEENNASFDSWPCPKCRQGRLRVIGQIAPMRRRAERPAGRPSG